MRRKLSAIRLLLAQPQRFHFDAALRILMRAARTQDDAQAAEFRTQPARFYPAGEITAVVRLPDRPKPRVTVAMIGLIGAGGVLPRLYEALAGESLRRGSGARLDFIDFTSHRIVAFFGQVGIKYRLHRSAELATLDAKPDPIGEAVLAVTGYGTPGLVERMEAGPDPLLHYAGLFAMRPRSADRLAALISDWLRWPVEVRQFAVSWLMLPPEQATSVGSAGGWNVLGGGAAIGVRSWDAHARVVLRIGPLDRASFQALLPNQPGYQRLASLVQVFPGPDIGFAINPVSSGPERFPWRLDATGLARLGRNSWVSRPGTTRLPDAREALFEVA